MCAFEIYIEGILITAFALFYHICAYKPNQNRRVEDSEGPLLIQRE